MDKRDKRNDISRDGARRPPFRAHRERPQGKETPLSAREVARRALSDVARSGSYVSAALDRHLNTTHLSADDKRLAASLFFTAVENRLLLEARLAQFWTERPEPVVEDILHIAAAQILLMDRIPDHAAVDEAVKQTRASAKEGLLVACGEGALEILEMQAPGGKRMSARAYLAGKKIEPGTKFGEGI